jgi:uncharacterized protein involved in outer membrane biogenesis
MNARNLIPGRRGLMIATGILAGVIVLYALAGFLLAPWLAKREIPRRAAEAGLQARIGEVAVNPFTLHLRVTGLAVEEPGGAPLLSLGAGEADIQWRPLLRGDLAFSELTLREPAVHARISEKGELNLAALGRPKAESDAPGRRPAIALERVAIENGLLSFEDRRQGYRNRFENLTLQLASISTAPNDTGHYELVARTADGGRLSWQGEVSLSPVSLSGKLVLEHGDLPQVNPYLESQTALRIASGRARVALTHRFTLADGKPALLVDDASVAIDRLALAMRGAEQPFATVGRLSLEGLKADLQARRATAQALSLGDFSLTARRDEHGAFQPRGFAPAASGSGQGNAWTIALAEMKLAGGSVSFADAASGLSWKLERIVARLRSLSSDTSQPIAFELEAAVAEGGRLAASGNAVPAAGAVQARIEASGIPLAPIEGLLARHARVKLLSGSLALAGDLTVGDEATTQRGRSAKLAYSGAASLDNVAIRDRAGAPLVQWKALATPALRLTLTPNRAQIDELRWTAPKGKLEISGDGTTNVGRAFRGTTETPGKPAPAPREAPPEAAAAGTGSARPDEIGDFPIRIRRVRVEQGSLDFADLSLNPHFSTLIHDLAGTVNGISTDRNTRSQIALEGRVNEYGHARLSGSLNPFDPEERTSFRVQLRNLEVARLSPYTIKFAGYRVASGRMAVDLNYRVNESRLEGDNKIVLDNFTLGERVAGNEAPVPLELAVALLKDPDGRIDLAVPISGSLDDPNFSLSEVIWKAIGNIVRNIVTAPFRALGRLFGDGSEALAAISFEPGAARLLPPEREKLKRIADGLAQRAELKVVIPARYDAEADAAALKRAALRQEIGRRAGFDPGEGDASSPINIEDRRTRSAVRELFAERFGADALERLKEEAEREAARDGKAPDLSLVERFRKFAGGEPRVADARGFYRSLFQQMLEAQALPEGALNELAQKRAAAIAEGLRAAGVDGGRVEVSSAEPTANAQAREVTVALSLAPLR